MNTRYVKRGFILKASILNYGVHDIKDSATLILNEILTSQVLLHLMLRFALRVYF